MKWSFTNRDIGGCTISTVSVEPTIVAIIPRPTRDIAGQERAREIAREIVLAHNNAQDLDRSSSVQCPHCRWGFFPSVIEQHIREKHGDLR